MVILKLHLGGNKHNHQFIQVLNILKANSECFTVHFLLITKKWWQLLDKLTLAHFFLSQIVNKTENIHFTIKTSTKIIYISNTSKFYNKKNRYNNDIGSHHNTIHNTLLKVDQTQKVVYIQMITLSLIQDDYDYLSNSSQKNQFFEKPSSWSCSDWLAGLVSQLQKNWQHFHGWLILVA